MKKIGIILVFSFASIYNAQENGVYSIADTMPTYPGGNLELAKFIQRNLYYPPTAIDQGHMGKAIVQFVIDTMGLVENPKVVKTSDYLEGSYRELGLLA